MWRSLLINHALKRMMFMTFMALLSLACGSAQQHQGQYRYVVTQSEGSGVVTSCGNQRAPQIWGVVVGVNEYQDDGITDLKGSVSDAWIFYHYLASPAGGKVPRGQLKLLLNHEATRTNVEGAIGNFLGQSCPQDKIIIYFAGHGAPEPGHPEEAFLLVHDTRLANMVGSAISMSRLPEFLKWRNQDVGELLLVVDACHSGNIMFPGKRGVKKPPRVAARERSGAISKSIKTLGEKRQSWSVISAAAANQYAGELQGACGGDVEYTGGIFTCYLLEGLKGDADANRDGAVSITEVFQYVRKRVSRATAGTQTPMFSGNENTKTPFFKVPVESAEIAIPRIPETYLIKEYRSIYTPVRWSMIGLTLATGVAAAMFNNNANTLTRDVNNFAYRSRTQAEYEQLVTERDEAITSTRLTYLSMGVFGVASIVTSLLELYDQPQQRDEVYQIKPWFSLPISEQQVLGHLGVKVDF